RIRFSRKAAGAFEHRAEALTALNTVAAGMTDLTHDGHGSANIGPSADLADGKHVARLEDHIGVSFARQRPLNANVAVLKLHVIAVYNHVARQIGGLAISAAPESSRQTQEVSRGHALGQRILSRPHDLTVD